MSSRLARSRSHRLLRRYGLYILLALALVMLGGLVWRLRDPLRSSPSLYREARAASTQRASRLYSVLEKRSPEIQEYLLLWSAQSEPPSPDTVSKLRDVIDYRPDSPAAHHAHLALARYYAGIESPRTVDEYKAALRLDDTADVRLELARYLEEQNASTGAYDQYLSLLGSRRRDAFAGMRRLAPDSLTVARDLIERYFCSDVVDILRDEQGCEAACLLARALTCLGHTDEAAAANDTCRACAEDAELADEDQAEPATQAPIPSPEDDPIDLWSSTWDIETEDRIEEAIGIYLQVAESDVYVSDDAAYRALVLARRQEDSASAARSLALLRGMQPSFLAWKATGELVLDLAPPYPDQAMDSLTLETMRKVSALESLGRQDLAEQELRFKARVSETPEVILRMAQELYARGAILSAYSLAVPYVLAHPYAPRGFWEMAYPRPYEQEVARWADEYGVEPELMWAIMRQESAFQPEIVSSAGARGLMQLMPENIADSVLDGVTMPSEDAFSPGTNIKIGAWHIGEVLSYFDRDVILALMAYNAGAGNVEQWLEEPTMKDGDDLLRFIPYGETREYVQRVYGNYLIYRALYAEE